MPKEQQKIWDGTVGLGGHLLPLAEAYPQAQLFASDADAAMLRLAHERLDGRVACFRHANFAENPFADESPLAFILLDLGISSVHLDHFERGFSFRHDQILDMRLDATKGRSAAELLARESEADLARIFRDYGEEKFSRRIAHEIVTRRQTDPIRTTAQLAELCKKFYPPRHRARGHAERHPATRVFQALRIAVNDELEALRRALAILPRMLAPGGRLAIITFHSLEDRLVKHAFRNLAQIRIDDPRAKSNFQPGDYQLIAPGGIVPDAEEVARNPRSRSARLRLIERRR